MTKKSVIIFTKVPAPGFVKTRLSEGTPLSEIDACLLAEAMLKDTIIIASKTKADIIEFGYYPQDNLQKLKEIVETVQKANNITLPIKYYLQKGTSFDERFGSVVQTSIDRGNDFIVVIGADLPYMTFSLINSAYINLAESDEAINVILGPAGEGGIYLVGISRKFNPNWFKEYNLFTHGIEIIQFAKFCKLEEIKLILLTPLTDIDIEDDLISLIAFVEGLKTADNNDNFHYPHYTAKVIESLGLYIKEISGRTRNRKIGKKN
ncbi:MAG: TIGR04282 family arsenosugar biosynthesis glycosyltransferase [Promethearchaeota archaeon]|jgi:glycosyltransferase A (GT-A) superfamily protein (DUF2064 family)